METNRNIPVPTPVELSPETFFVVLMDNPTWGLMKLVQISGETRESKVNELRNHLLRCAKYATKKIADVTRKKRWTDDQLRMHSKQFAKARKKVDAALKNLADAELAVQSELGMLPPGYFNFLPRKTSLKALQKKAAYAENFCNYRIRPYRMSEKKKRALASGPRIDFDSSFRRVSVPKIRSKLLDRIDKKIKDFFSRSPRRVPRRSIDPFILNFLAMCCGESPIAQTNLEKMRRRIRKRADQER